MKILALEHPPTGSIAVGPFTEELLKREARRVWELYQTSIIRELYFRADQHVAVLVLECASLEEARLVLTTLPLVYENLIEFEIIPLIPYPGFARLFTTKE